MQRLARRLAAAAGGRAPVPLIECLRRLDHREAVVLEEELHARVRGAVSLVEGRWVVLLNARDVRARARFTLAHEIGHVALGVQGAGSTCGEGLGPRSREALCDAFAAELLMPAAAVRAAWPELGSVEALARRYEVSRVAARRRVRELGLKT